MPDDDILDLDDNDNDDDAGNQDPPEAKKVTVSRDQLKSLQAKAKQAAAADRLLKENALLRMGVDLESAGGKLLLDHPGLDVSKPDEVKELAKAIGAFKDPGADTATTDQNATDGSVSAEELNQTHERSNLASGASPDGTDANEDPYQVAVRVQRETLKAGGKQVDALAAAMKTIREAALKGDERVIYNPTDVRQHYPAAEAF